MYNIKVSEQDIRDMNIISINDELNEDYMVEDDSEYNKATASNNQYEDDVENEYLKYKVDLLLKNIDKYPKEKEVIKMLFGVGYDRAYTNIEVGEMFAMKDVEVESLKRKIILYLKRKVTSNSAKKQLPSSEEWELLNKLKNVVHQWVYKVYFLVRESVDTTLTIVFLMEFSWEKTAVSIFLVFILGII